MDDDPRFELVRDPADAPEGVIAAALRGLRREVQADAGIIAEFVPQRFGSRQMSAGIFRPAIACIRDRKPNEGTHLRPVGDARRLLGEWTLIGVTATARAQHLGYTEPRAIAYQVSAQRPPLERCEGLAEPT